METLQTVSLATIWETVKTIIAWLAAIGIVIDLTPGITFQPVRYMLKQLGNLINADIKKQIDELQKQFNEFKIDSWRTEILDFSDSCMNHQKHTKEQFEHVIDIIDKYDNYTTTNKLKNGQVDVAHEYIIEIYKQCIRENNFILDEQEEQAKKAAAIAARNKARR